jgi:hypothetical protein
MNTRPSAHFDPAATLPEARSIPCRTFKESRSPLFDIYMVGFAWDSLALKINKIQNRFPTVPVYVPHQNFGHSSRSILRFIFRSDSAYTLRPIDGQIRWNVTESLVEGRPRYALSSFLRLAVESRVATAILVFSSQLSRQDAHSRHNFELNNVLFRFFVGMRCPPEKPLTPAEIVHHSAHYFSRRTTPRYLR